MNLSDDRLISNACHRNVRQKRRNLYVVPTGYICAHSCYFSRLFRVFERVQHFWYTLFIPFDIYETISIFDFSCYFSHILRAIFRVLSYVHYC